MKRTVLAVFILALTGSLLAEEKMIPNENVVYKAVTNEASEHVELQLHIFNSEGHLKTDKRPALVFFFGGGWNGGTPEQFYPHSHYFASRGMVAISAEYRVKSRHGTSPRACVKDGKSAVRWIRAHAGELGIDPGQLIAGGGSAGGHVAAATATVKDFNEDGEDLNVSCRPQALVLFNPVFDNGPEGYGYDRVQDYWQDFSPMHNIDAHTPPTIVFLGTKDKLIPTATAEKYKKLMIDKGLRCELHLYEGEGHGFFNFKNYENYVATVVEADRFLASLGYLEGEPTL
ncbi:MAG: acetyl esterase [Candidatus Latescibacterota bacterium]|jgi:acetyl esterase